ncbi:nucleolin-like [Vanessa cardui]|uniref:nucleolin-like n=1 Tax=Vanessa cardui TaxID=171605 RepID=UPI001F141AB4|nr:nucleolin-like [Vanessa cardui]
MAKLSEVSPVKPDIIKKKKRRQKKNKAKTVTTEPQNKNNEGNVDIKIEQDIKKNEDSDQNVTNERNEISDELAEKYPVLKNDDLVKKFLGVTMTNNQKGRIRQQLRDNLKGTSEVLLPEVIHNRIQGIVKDIITLTDAELRKIRILYNMLKTSVQTESTASKVEKKKKKKKNKKPKDKVKVEADKTENEATDNKAVDKVEKEEIKKTKGPKRYVVFVGNLPLDIDREKLTHHFYEIREHIVDVRIPKPAEGKKSCIAYVELKNEPSYELALSKHHSMLDNRRINVLYTTQQNSKISKTEAKSKSAKLVALQKSGKLMGSISLNKKRSHRRMKAKKAKASQEAES